MNFRLADNTANSSMASEFRFEKLRIAALLMLLSLCVLSNYRLNADDFFEKKVRPLLVKRCYECHSGTKSSGGLSLDSAEGWRKGGDSGAALVPGNLSQSLMVDAINYRSIEMPPQNKGGKLPDEEIKILEKWIETGAVDPRKSNNKLGGMSLKQAKKWWAFQPLPRFKKNLTPDLIDSLIQTQLDQNGLHPEKRASRRTLLRRMTFGLTGLPPTTHDAEAFESDDSPDAIGRLIERLLKSPQYGVHWGRRWLDVIRYADTAGENTDRPLPHAWRFRNWVFDSFNNDLPYDQFVRQQIAGDLIRTEKDSELESHQKIVATGYLAIARRFGHDIDKDIHLMYEDVIDNVGKNFLGLTLGCARCHDHKYDPITAEDYYALYGIFDSTLFSFPGCEPKGQPRDLIPLLDQTKVKTLNEEYQKALNTFNEKKLRQKKLAQAIKKLASTSYQVLSQALVKEGQSEPIERYSNNKLDKIRMRRGEVLQLSILPNTSYGADTTRIQWSIEQLDGEKRLWNTDDLISKYGDSGPAIPQKGATWCLLEVTDGPAFLSDKKIRVGGKDSLKGWARGDNPSSIVNDSTSPVSAWTTLPAKSLFVHPGINRNVAIAWICPADGSYRVRGIVTDAHPAGGLDGVTFRFEHFKEPKIGASLVELAELTITTKPMPPSFPVAYAVREKDSPPRDAQIQMQGDPEKLGPVIPRRWLSVFGGERIRSVSKSGRLELADRIINHPLFARVMVNRVWQWHFGQGLVATPNDFGSRGDPPSHPELLDRLAAFFKANDYKIKPLHRLILQTKAYQRKSTSSTSERDPGNRLLASFDVRRLTAEEIRDSLLFFSGELRLEFAKHHPFPPESQWTYTQHAPFNAVYPSQHRSAFLMVQRQRRHPFLALFDGADPNSSTPKRDSTTVPSQALFFLNDPFFHRQANKIAQRVSPRENARASVAQAFKLIFQRRPTDDEESVALRFLKNYPGNESEKWNAYARVLLSSNELIYIE